RAEAEKAFDLFLRTYEAKYPKATACLGKDRKELLVFYDFPAEHWMHLRTTNVYDHLFTAGGIIEVGCWVHCRRHFFEAKDSDPTRAHLVLARIRQLYEVEAEAKKFIVDGKLQGDDADAVRFRLRQEKALQVVTSLYQWLEQEQPKVLPKRPIGLAIAYALAHQQMHRPPLLGGFVYVRHQRDELAH